MKRRAFFLVAVLAALPLLNGCSAGTQRPTPAAGVSPAPTQERLGGEPRSTSEASSSALQLRAVVSGGKVETARSRVDVRVAETIRIEVIADVADEIHVHGYDLKAPVRPGEAGVIQFVADIPGVFEVELENSRLTLFELRIR